MQVHAAEQLAAPRAQPLQKGTSSVRQKTAVHGVRTVLVQHAQPKTAHAGAHWRATLRLRRLRQKVQVGLKPQAASAGS